MTAKILISDFDGTMTARDFYLAALDRLPPSSRRHWQRYESGEVTHFEALAAVFAELRVSHSEFAAMLAEMELAGGLGESISRLQRSGWSTAIASAGCSCYIGQLLSPLQLNIAIHANPGEFTPENGVVMHLPVTSPFFSPTVGIDKGAIVRHYLDKGYDVAFAGDGRPDLAPALMLPPQRRFARGWLAETLQSQGEQFITFGRWEEIADHLLAEEPSC